MKIMETSLPGVFVIEPKVFQDERGFFLESFNQEKYSKFIADAFVQDNHSLSMKNTLRGLHAQNPHSQGKLVRVIHGEVFDVAVDIRVGSPNFGQWYGENLSAENFRQLYIPPGFAHGFCVLSESAEFEYKCTDVYHPETELVLAWDDAEAGVEWPIDAPILSERDRRGQSLGQLKKQGRLPIYAA